MALGGAWARRARTLASRADTHDSATSDCGWWAGSAWLQHRAKAILWWHAPMFCCAAYYRMDILTAQRREKKLFYNDDDKNQTTQNGKNYYEKENEKENARSTLYPLHVQSNVT